MLRAVLYSRPLMVRLGLMVPAAAPRSGKFKIISLLLIRILRAILGRPAAQFMETLAARWAKIYLRG